MTALRRATHAFLLVAVMLGLSATLVPTGTASAHATRVASDPAENAELARPPARVSATFNEPMQALFAAMTVVGPDGAQWSDGDVAVDGTVIGVAVRPGGPAGVYTVNYRATSADGHVVTGSWSFRVLTAAGPAPGTQAAPATAAPVPAEADGADGIDGTDGMPAWPFVAAVTVIVAGGALWAVRRRS